VMPRRPTRAVSAPTGSNPLEEVKDVLRARCRPKSEEMVIRISEGPTAGSPSIHAIHVPARSSGRGQRRDSRRVQLIRRGPMDGGPSRRAASI
jgi:hypothetical protein